MTPWTSVLGDRLDLRRDSPTCDQNMHQRHFKNSSSSSSSHSFCVRPAVFAASQRRQTSQRLHVEGRTPTIERIGKKNGSLSAGALSDCCLGPKWYCYPDFILFLHLELDIFRCLWKVCRNICSNMWCFYCAHVVCIDDFNLAVNFGATITIQNWSHSLSAVQWALTSWVLPTL